MSDNYGLHGPSCSSSECIAVGRHTSLQHMRCRRATMGLFVSSNIPIIWVISWRYFIEIGQISSPKEAIMQIKLIQDISLLNSPLYVLYYQGTR